MYKTRSPSRTIQGLDPEVSRYGSDNAGSALTPALTRTHARLLLALMPASNQNIRHEICILLHHHILYARGSVAAPSSTAFLKALTPRAIFYRTEADAISRRQRRVFRPDKFLSLQPVHGSDTVAGTDDCEWGFGRNTSNTDKTALDKFTFDPGTNLFYQFWSTSYQVINRANAAVEGIGRQ